uniref:Thioredoxin domain-containing protein n=1 Tax=viral metagenome TaxID=1070528 RepID=A0A6C0IWQ3_9ZZZZ
MSEKPIVSYFQSRHHFLKLLEKNPGLVIIKLGASWCRPCKTIKPIVDAFFVSSPDNVICCDVDVDESDDLYTYFKSKRMVNGIPVILCYKKGNTSYIPDDSITGSDPVELDKFFKRCGLHLASVNRGVYPRSPSI